MSNNAEERLYQGEAGLQNTITALSKVVVDQCNGYDSFNTEQKYQLRRVFYELLDIRDRLIILILNEE